MLHHRLHSGPLLIRAAISELQDSIGGNKGSYTISGDITLTPEQRGAIGIVTTPCVISLPPAPNDCDIYLLININIIASAPKDPEPETFSVNPNGKILFVVDGATTGTFGFLGGYSVISLLYLKEADGWILG